MKILIVTLADRPYWPIARISNPNKAAYAAKHGYDFRAYTSLKNTSKPASWNKLFVIKDAIWENYYDWIFWTDADSLVMNSGMNLEEIITKKHTERAIISSDSNGFNFGQFLISSSVWSNELISAADRAEEYLTHPWWEQAALNAVIKEHQLEDRFTVVDQSKLNRLIPNGPEHNTFDLLRAQVDSVWQRDDFILHFAGMGGERSHLRLAVMEDYLSYAQ